MSSHDEHVPVPEGYPVQSCDERVFVRMGSIWAGLIGLTTLIVVSMGLVRAFDLALSKDRPNVERRSVKDGFEQPAGVAVLSPDQVAIRKQYEEKQNVLLTTYGWQDEKHSVARLPIARAMSLVVKKYESAR
ncbi:hypothetical protein [Planctomicrobium sp. SH527]|uniref:hypothetical protein n=1 Tax=Planctomicrobium sp. SH527 TaxID=3448123 RepID=UPI003F5B54C6